MSGFGTKTSTPGVAPSTTPVRIAWAWFAFGVAAWSLLPALRDYSPQAGWLSYWLVGAPLLVLATIYRQVLTARLRSILVGSQPDRGGGAVMAGSRVQWRQGWRRRAHGRAQARRVGPSRRSLVRALTAVLFR